jgi:hypothetical protein
MIACSIDALREFGHAREHRIILRFNLLEFTVAMVGSTVFVQQMMIVQRVPLPQRQIPSRHELLVCAGHGQ